MVTAPLSGMKGNRYLVGESHGRSAHIRRGDGAALRVSPGGVVGALHQARAGAIRRAIQQRIGPPLVGYSGRRGWLCHSQQKRNKREDRRKDPKSNLLHCNITGIFVTFMTKASINHTHQEDDKPPEPRTAKFGEFAAKSG
jgi:hypothetical protein